IYNYQGQVVMRNNISNGQIDMSKLSSGVYFVEIRTNNNVSVEKVIVK
ncbi:MAG: T9SS type A sorting domain-containing protein, partial [Bacteroidales bacterium]|nr:T9SS type A sorting domain-containing protein [Bacteroidales bacterium]